MITTGYADADMLLTSGQNRPGDKLTGFDAFVIHGTANPAPGANAVMHYKYWMPGGAGRTVSSVHFVADEFRVWQLLPINEVGWHVGRGALANGQQPGFRTVAIEMCENSGSNYVATCQRSAKVVARVLKAYGKQPIDGVTLRPHKSFSPQYTTHDHCPAWLTNGVQGMTWTKFVQLVKDAYAALDGGLAVRAAPRIGAATFNRTLVEAQSPAASVATDLYPLLCQTGLDPAVALAFFGHESRFGTLGICHDFDTKNWGNVRTPFDPTVATTIETPKGQFAKYDSWYVGLVDWCKRINERYIKQRGLDTVEEILPVYAPASDGNVPTAYIASVRGMVAKWIAEDALTFMVTPDDGANVREGPGTTFPIANGGSDVLPKGATVRFEQIVAGQSIGGTNQWGQLGDKRFISLSILSAHP